MCDGYHYLVKPSDWIVEVERVMSKGGKEGVGLSVVGDRVGSRKMMSR